MCTLVHEFGDPLIFGPPEETPTAFDPSFGQGAADGQEHARPGPELHPNEGRSHAQGSGRSLERLHGGVCFAQ